MKLVKNQTWIKKLSVLGLVTTLSMAVMPTAAAQVDVDGTLSVGSCVVQGNVQFVEFLQASTFSDGINDGLFEPFKDALVRNNCQSFDVYSLIKQRDKVRTQIREAFFSCNVDRADTLKRAFNEVNAEIYYVRNVVDGNVISKLPFDTLSTMLAQNPQQFYYPTTKLYQQMSERYVESGRILEEDFIKLFNQWESKYAERKANYVVCESDSWETVADKWEEFISTAGGITPAWNDLEEGVKGEASKLARNTTDTGFKEWITGLVQVNINNQAARPGVDRLISDISQYVPSSDTPTLSTVLKAIESEGKQYNVQETRAELTDNFTALYKGASDQAVEVMVGAVDSLNRSLSEALNPLDQLRSCSKTINDRQCP